MTVKYQLISEAVILRDIITPKYLNKEHEMLADIADAIYNADLTREYLKPEYQKLYDEYGQEYWQKIFKDMDAIETQLDGHEQELIEEYNDLLQEQERGD